MVSASPTTTLRDRLRGVIAEPRIRPQAPPLPRAVLPIVQILGGEWHGTPLGSVFVKDQWYPLDHLHGALPVSSALTVGNETLGRLFGDQPGAPDPSRLAFFDVETTGLSGGAGTYVVIAGVGSYEVAASGEQIAFRMRQYFLADLAQETAMLAMMGDDLARFEGLVTYNGRTFDMPVTETRFALSRRRSPFASLPHLDLLHVVRRLYKHRMAGCRLMDVERRLLRVERVDDIPGALVPSLYREHLCSGATRPMRGVLRHNAEDVLSLVGLLGFVGRMLQDPDLAPDDAVAVARWWEGHDDPGRAAALYRNALPWLEGSEHWHWATARLAGLCRRRGDRAEAGRLWRRLWHLGDRAAGLRLAIQLEHHDRNLSEAAALTECLLQDALGDERADLARRLGRLRAKLERHVNSRGDRHGGVEPQVQILPPAP